MTLAVFIGLLGRCEKVQAWKAGKLDMLTERAEEAAKLYKLEVAAGVRGEDES